MSYKKKAASCGQPFLYGFACCFVGLCCLTIRHLDLSGIQKLLGVRIVDRCINSDVAKVVDRAGHRVGGGLESDSVAADSVGAMSQSLPPSLNV